MTWLSYICQLFQGCTSQLSSAIYVGLFYVNFYCRLLIFGCSFWNPMHACIVQLCTNQSYCYTHMSRIDPCAYHHLSCDTWQQQLVAQSPQYHQFCLTASHIEGVFWYRQLYAAVEHHIHQFRCISCHQRSAMKQAWPWTCLWSNIKFHISTTLMLSVLAQPGPH